MNITKRSLSEEIKFQAEHYNEVPLWTSLRGKAFIIVALFTVLISLTFVLSGDYAVALVSLFIFSLFAYFMLKGKQWAFISLIILYSVDTFIKVYELILAEQILLLLIPVMLWLFVCKNLSNALGVEQLRAKYVKT